MKKSFTLLALLACIGSAWAQANCSNAVAALPGTIYPVTYPPQDNQIPQPLCLSGNNTATKGAWYSFTPDQNYTVTVTTSLTGYPSVDTRLHIYKGTCSSMVCVAGDDDSGEGYSSTVSFAALANTTYYIAFDNKWTSQTFSFLISLSEYVAPVPPPVTFTPATLNISGSYILGAVDMNGDFLDDIVSPANGSVGIFYQKATGGFTPATLTSPSTTYLPGWSMAAGDYNKDGFNDLLYGNQNKAVIMLSNNTGTAFATALTPGQSTFCQRTNFIDINNDGHLDAFVCHDTAPNVYFKNNGSGGFTWHQGGLGNYSSGGNYGSIWLDYDNDGDSDLFIAKCRGAGNPASLNELHRNNGNGSYTNVSVAANLSDMLQTWSSAVGDYDNDGDMDIFVGANSDANGMHKMMKNNGDGTFTDVTAGTGLETFTALGREHVAHDFDNDGFIDIMGGGNKLLINNGDMTFRQAYVNATNGPIADLNNDGFLDILNENTVYFSDTNANNWIKLHLKGTVSNSNGIGARVEIYGAWGKQIRDVRSGDGFEFMSSLNTHFGIGTATAITQVKIKWPSGVTDIINNPAINQPLLVTEGSTLGTEEMTTKALTLFPNPAKDFIEISGDKKTELIKASIYDLSGKLVKTSAIRGGTISVHSLSKGCYIIILQDISGNSYPGKFIKE